MKPKPVLPIQVVPGPYFNFLVLLAIIVLPLMFLTRCQSEKTKIQNDTAPEFHNWAPTPPMGWNSWDCYGPTVVEEEVKANADYMAARLKKYGWEYIVVDIRWYVANDKVRGI